MGAKGDNMKLSMRVMYSIIIIAISCNTQVNYQPIPPKSPTPGQYMIDNLEPMGDWGTLDQPFQGDNSLDINRI
jgi:hypothetical protein